MRKASLFFGEVWRIRYAESFPKMVKGARGVFIQKIKPERKNIGYVRFMEVGKDWLLEKHLG